MLKPTPVEQQRIPVFWYTRRVSGSRCREYRQQELVVFVGAVGFCLAVGRGMVLPELKEAGRAVPFPANGNKRAYAPPIVTEMAGGVFRLG